MSVHQGLILGALRAGLSVRPHCRRNQELRGAHVCSEPNGEVMPLKSNYGWVFLIKLIKDVKVGY